MAWKFATVVAPALAVLAAAGCADADSTRVSRCAERIADSVERPDNYSRVFVEEYARRGYCLPFDRKGWVYDDGTLKLAAYTHGRKCSESSGSGRARPVSCSEVEHGLLDCGLLRFVRKREAQRYIAEQRRKGPVACDDQTPLRRVGA